MYSTQSYGAPHGQNASSLVELSLAARRLSDRDITSKSDPQCVVYMKNGFDGKFIEIGRTEVIKNNLNPDWVKKLEVNYRFNESQQMKFEVWDVDPISGNEFLGQCVAELGAIVASRGGTYQQKLTTDINGRGRGGELIIRAEEVSANRQSALIHFEAANLDKKDFMGKSDPYLVISKANNDGTFSVVHKTEVIKNTVNASWRPFNISLQQLCGGDFDRTLKIDCYDYDEGTNHDIIGSFTTNLRKLSSGPSQLNTYECINLIKQNRKGYTNSGVIRLISINIRQDGNINYAYTPANPNTYPQSNPGYPYGQPTTTAPPSAYPSTPYQSSPTAPPGQPIYRAGQPYAPNQAAYPAGQQAYGSTQQPYQAQPTSYHPSQPSYPPTQPSVYAAGQQTYPYGQPAYPPAPGQYGQPSYPGGGSATSYPSYPSNVPLGPYPPSSMPPNPNQTYPPSYPPQPY